MRTDDQWNKAGWNVGRHVLDKVHVSHLRATSPLPLNSQKPERNKSIPTEEQLIAALNCSVPLGLSDWSRGSHVPTLPLTNEPMIVFQPLSLIYVNEMNGTGKAQVEEAYNQRCSSWQLMTTNDGEPPSYPRTIYISGNPLNFFFFFSFVILVRCPLDPPPSPTSSPSDSAHEYNKQNQFHLSFSIGSELIGSDSTEIRASRLFLHLLEEPRRSKETKIQKQKYQQVNWKPHACVILIQDKHTHTHTHTYIYIYK